MARLIISTDKSVNDKATAKVLGKDNRPELSFKDEGGFYIAKLTKDGQPIDPMEMYEYGTLQELTAYSKRDANKIANERGFKAMFD